ncbi:hypothetical protein PQX77_019264 [Marasmius sp. AFHP31]|nr:hypothetical protein PQX77_019264 [Marasmius sp. AFHP31]
MSIPSNFRNAQRTTIGDHANLQAVAGDLTITTNNNNNYYHSSEGGLITINGRTIRRVIDGDIIYRRLLSSKVLSINTKPEGASTSTELQVFRIKKTVQTARLHGRRGKFTATTFELIDEKDRDDFVKLVKNVLEAAMCQRSTLLTQLFAVAESNGLTLIAHDELANAQEFFGRYRSNWIVGYYLSYAYNVTIESLHDDEIVTFPVTRRIGEDWLFNVKSLTWQYDLASVLLNPPSEQDLVELFHNTPTPLRQETLPRLDTAEIVACVEESFGDVLHLLTLYGRSRLCDLSNLAQHRLLTFGAVLSYNKREILAHFPSFPSPEWYCKSSSPDVKASFSSSVPWRVDLAFHKTGHTQVTLDFSWRIPEKHRDRLHCAYLCQLLSFYNDSDVEKIILVNEIGFSLKGAFPDDPTTRSTPAYLFVPPLPTEVINNTHCICYPLPEKLFYWSHDPQGRTAIIEEDWEKFGIPKFSMKGWFGSRWEERHYACVRDHLQSGDYELDGKRYARDHGYPELVHADPHDNAIEELIYSDNSDSEWSTHCKYPGSDREVSPSHSPPLPSPSSLSEAPTKHDTEHEDSESAQPVSHWAKPVFIKWYKSVLATLAEADGLDHSVVAC